MPRHRNVESHGGDGWLCNGEDPVDQQRSVELFRDLVTEAPEEWTKLFDSYLDFAVRHTEIIDRSAVFRAATPSSVASRRRRRSSSSSNRDRGSSLSLFDPPDDR